MLEEDLMLGAVLFLEEMQIDGLIEDMLEGLLGLGGFSHDALERTTVEVVAEQAQAPVITGLV